MWVLRRKAAVLGENFVSPCEEGRAYSELVVHRGYSQGLKGEGGAASELSILQAVGWDTGCALQE